MQESTRQQYLQAMGIQMWEMKFSPEEVKAETDIETNDGEMLVPTDAEKLKPAEISDNHSELDWGSLRSRVESCEDCQLHESRIYPVFGAGNQTAKLMFIGEAPGADEDRQGEPFVGQAGHLLDEMLLAIGFKREQVYITNMLKCRPPGNRDPESAELSCCESFLLRQIALLQPELIVALGRVAAQNLLKCDSKLGDLRGQLQSVPGISPPILVTYHPAYLIRKPLQKRKAWDDLKTALAVVQKGDQA